MKKIFCGAIIALIGVIYSIALMALATVYDVRSSGVSGLWGLLQVVLCQDLVQVKMRFSSS